jgi:hypothetical protein
MIKRLGNLQRAYMLQWIVESEVITLLFVDEKFHNQFVNGWKLINYIFLDEVCKKKKEKGWDYALLVERKMN